MHQAVHFAAAYHQQPRKIFGLTLSSDEQHQAEVIDIPAQMSAPVRFCSYRA
jgi:hypothetical protein